MSGTGGGRRTSRFTASTTGSGQFHGVAAHGGADAYVSEALARELGAQAGDAILMRVEKPSAIPLESLHGRKDDPGRTIRLTSARLWTSSSSGSFRCGRRRGMFSPFSFRCGDCSAIWREPGRVNTLLLASSAFPKDKVTLDDLGIKVRSLTGRNALSVEAAARC